MTDSVAECTETLDPRVQIELERLNTATDEINRLEVELDEARLAFRRLLAEGHIRIQQLTKKLGTSVHKARPYYEARFRANITSQELLTANLAYDKANSAHAAAREMVYLAEQGLARLAEGSGGLTLDPAWQEMLNHATHRVNQAEADRASATVTQRSRAAAHRAASALVQQLQNGLKRHITKSRHAAASRITFGHTSKRRLVSIPPWRAKRLASKLWSSRWVRPSSGTPARSETWNAFQTRYISIAPEDSPLGTSNSPFADIDRSTITDTASESNASEALEELVNNDESVREWLRRADRSDPDTWTEIDLDYSSPEEISFEKCSLRPRSTPEKSSPPSPLESKVSAASPRRIIRVGDRGHPLADRLGDHRGDRGAALRAELERGRRQSLDALLHDTGEKVKEMFQGLSLFGERRGSGSAPRTPRRSSPAPDAASSASDERYSDTDSLASVEMLTDEQIASLMLDAQLEAVCERLAGVARSPDTRY